MPLLKPIAGHGSIYPLQRYLERDGRALMVECINLDKLNDQGKTWSYSMDQTRKVYNNNRSTNGKRARTFNHYVLSPDPQDHVSAEELRDFSREWAEQAFPEFEVAIVLHDDNKNGIMHAHIVVNNTNLLTGERLGTYLNNCKVREIACLVQDMAKERGWHNFLDQDKNQAKKEVVKAEGFQGFSVEQAAQHKRKAFETRQDAYYTKSEQEVLRRMGWSWKEDLRCRIRIAKELSRTEAEFINTLTMLGVQVNVGHTDDDYQYIHPEKKT